MALAAAAIALSCRDANAPRSHIARPSGVTASAVRMNAVSLRWKPATRDNVVAYRIERRANLGGSFATVVARYDNDASLEQLAFLDVGVEPETYYGYRVRAINGAGEISDPSVIAGAHTPPRPAIDVITTTQLAAAAAADPNGYEITIDGPATAASPIAGSGRHRFPLPVGQYRVTLGGLVARCVVQGAPSRTVTLSDTGVNTVAAVSYTVACNDPNRGRIVVTVATTGDERDDAYTVSLDGLAADNTLPPSERVIVRQQSIEGAQGATSFDNLRPGSYQARLGGIARNCALSGAATRDVSVSAGSLDTVRFAVACEGATAPPPPTGRPLVLRNAWSAASAAPNAKVVLRMSLDATARPSYRISSVQSELRYDPAVVRIDSVKPPAGGMTQQDWGTVAGSPGVILHFAQEIAGLTGTVAVADFHFTVIGAAGTRAITRTTLSEVVDASSRLLTDSAYVVEDTLPIASGGGQNPPPTNPPPTNPPPVNQPPTARINGPYSGTVGLPIAFSAAGSSDPEGGALTYSWSFGDGSSASGVAPSKTYASHGTYTVTLTVADDKGATATATTTATVAAAAAKPLTWTYSFGAMNAADSVVIMTITYDLTPNLDETPGVEALQSWAVDSLRWNPAVLKLYAFNFGPGGLGSVNSTYADQGKLIFNGTLPAAQSTDLLTIATIRFKVRAGSGGQSTQTKTSLGALVGQPSTGPYVYNAKTTVVEKTFTAP